MSDLTLPQFLDPRDQPTQSDLSIGASCPVVQRVGDYQLLYELGRGGMGVVFKARDGKLNRFVAVKMILPGAMPDETDLERFQTEAAAAAGLKHPNIVAVHAVGQQDGRWYYCMDLIEGPSLAKRLASGPLPGRAAARYLVGVARGIDHAHKNGVLHRDLKPANILLDADDQPHVADFGLAKQMSRDHQGCTRTGAVLGTPSYMAPEQASGSKEIGPACDIYGLGALLYELLTGRPPFQAETPLDTLMQVLERDPAPPRLLNHKVDRDLETICLKCLQKDPARRYPSAAMMADDLERYLNGESIRARTFSMIDRIAWTLEHSQYDVQFGAYGTMLYWFAAIVMTTQIAKHVLMATGQAIGWVAICQGVQFAPHFSGVLPVPGWGQGRRALDDGGAAAVVRLDRLHRRVGADRRGELAAVHRGAGLPDGGIPLLRGHGGDGVFLPGQQLLGLVLRVRPGVLRPFGADAVRHPLGGAGVRGVVDGVPGGPRARLRWLARDRLPG